MAASNLTIFLGFLRLLHASNMAGVDSRRLLNAGSISPHSMGSVSSSMAESPPVNVEEETCLVELFLSNIW